MNTSDCIPSDAEKKCGNGQIDQTRKCTPGNIEPCTDVETQRKMDCHKPCTEGN